MKKSFNYKKAITIVNILAQKKPDITKIEVIKLIYLAEKEHLKRFGRLIINDRIMRLPMGPVESKLLDIINGKAILTDEENDFFNSNIIVSKDNHKKIRSKKKPDTIYLSKSEEIIINEIFEKYKNIGISKLINITHDKAWEKGAENTEITINDIILEFDKTTQKEIELYQKEIQEDLAFASLFQ